MIELIECEACNSHIDIDTAIVEKYTEDPRYGQQEMYFCPECADEDVQPGPDWDETEERLKMEGIR